jgi:hypothetical protein
MRKGYIFVKVLKCWELLENSGLVMAICEFHGYDRNLRFSIEARYSQKLSYVPFFHNIRTAGNMSR